MGDLTAEKIAIIQSDWAAVRQNVKQNGVDFFIFFFKSNPGYQDMFKTMRGLSDEELNKSAALRSHALRVMYAISSLVDNLSDDLDAVVEILKKMTDDHYPRGIKLSHFQNLFNNLIEFLGNKLGSGFGAKNKAAWGTLAGVMLGVIDVELKGLMG